MTEILKKKQEILVGSSKLNSLKENHFDKNKFFVENMMHNKAFLYHVKKNHIETNSQEHLKLLENFRTRYINYRSDWVNSLKVKNINRPLSIDVELASICDLACPHCSREYIVTPDKIMNMDLYKKIIDEISIMEVPSIKLNWRGEPLLHPNIFECIDYAKKKGILEVIINTNATSLTKKKSEELIDSGLDYIIYSFDGGSKATYEKMRPGRFKKNAYENVIQNIKNFKEIRDQKNAKFPVTKIQMIMTSETRNEINDFYKTFGTIVDDVTVTQYNERGGNLNDLDANTKNKLTNYLNENNLPLDTSYMVDIDKNIFISKKRKPCEQIYQRLMITYNGRVGMCCHDWGAQHGIGYISQDAFEEDKKFKEVFGKINEKKKGFELMPNAKLPTKFNEPKKSIDKIENIWKGKELNTVRNAHENDKVNSVEVCKNCTFKDTYEWEKITL